MDIDYLLLLQHFREVTGEALTPVMMMLSNFIVSFWPMAAFCLIYWGYDKKAGEWLLANYTFGTFLNGVLKLTACIYRPWVKDARIVPAGNAKDSATGYSFPSGHASFAAFFYGSIALDQWKKRRALSIISLSLAALTLFSRNYLGVHTPQDVIAGFCTTVMIIFFTRFLLKHESGRFDLFFPIALIMLTIAALVYITVKSYPLDYADGKLLVDPDAMKLDTYMGCGTMAGFAIGYFIEHRFIRFTVKKDNKRQLTVALFLLAVLYFFYTAKFHAGGNTRGSPFSMFMCSLLSMIYVMVIAPAVLKKSMKPLLCTVQGNGQRALLE